MELDREDTVTQIDEARARVAADDRAAIVRGAKDPQPGAGRRNPIAAKTTGARRAPLCQHRRQRRIAACAGTPCGHDFLNADGVERLERPELPAKPHCRTRSTSSMPCEISGVTFAQYTSVGARVARRNAPTRSWPRKSVLMRTPVDAIDCAASIDGSRAGIGGRYWSVAGSMACISFSPPGCLTRL